MYRPKEWYTMVKSPFMYDGVELPKKHPQKALELELQHQAFRLGQEAGADAIVEGLKRDKNAIFIDGQPQISIIFNESKKGTLVFIPDES